MTVLVGNDVGWGGGTLIRVPLVADADLQLAMARNDSRLLVGPNQSANEEVPGLRVWSNDAGLARWWLTPAALREQLERAGPQWGFRIEDGALEAHSPQREDPDLQRALSAVAALATRGRQLQPQVAEARQSIRESAVELELVREQKAATTFFDTRTRFSTARTPGQPPFLLERYLASGCKHLYDEVAPARVEADEFMLHLYVSGVLTDAEEVQCAARLAKRLAEPVAASLDEGPYR